MLSRENLSVFSILQGKDVHSQRSAKWHLDMLSDHLLNLYEVDSVASNLNLGRGGFIMAEEAEAALFGLKAHKTAYVIGPYSLL